MGTQDIAVFWCPRGRGGRRKDKAAENLDQIGFKVTRDEKELLEAMSRAMHLSLSDVVRKSLGIAAERGFFEPGMRGNVPAGQ